VLAVPGLVFVGEPLGGECGDGGFVVEGVEVGGGGGQGCLGGGEVGLDPGELGVGVTDQAEEVELP
jgi:hypothetical protein